MFGESAIHKTVIGVEQREDGAIRLKEVCEKAHGFLLHGAAQSYKGGEVAFAFFVERFQVAHVQPLAAEFGGEAGTDYGSLTGRVDAVSVAVPTPQHFEVVKELLAAGLHVIVEKPMTHDVATADALVKLAEQQDKVLMVGQIERFSPGYAALGKLVTNPLYFESYRISPFRERGIDTDVVFDLMIHDIDMILGLVSSEVIQVDAVGTPLFSNKADVANARIVFKSGCVANVTASRVSYKVERTLRVFQPKSYLVCNFIENQIFQYTAKGDIAVDGMAAIASDILTLPKEDSLANEIEEFLQSILKGRRPAVDVRAGREAVRVASLIIDSIRQHRHLLGVPAGAAR